MSSSWHDTPIYIINRNNLERGFRQQYEWFKSAGMRNITVIDNASTYQPLLDYYNNNGVKHLRMDKNYGPWVFWDKSMHWNQETKYVVTDPDVVPAPDCPKDLVRKMCEVFDRYQPKCLKVGPGLRIDNIPDHYAKKEKVLAHEAQFNLECHRMPEGDAFDALIDTTMAVYGPHAPFPDWCQHFRLAAPYVCEHFPWYEDSSVISEEHAFYREHAENGWASWEAN